jgi:multidrug efflux pump subunit AcrA (membrane-fusion protein)
LAGIDGIVRSISREPGAQVAAGELILEIEPAESGADHARQTPMGTPGT